jgi:hypothetical protein
MTPPTPPAVLLVGIGTAKSNRNQPAMAYPADLAPQLDALEAAGHPYTHVRYHAAPPTPPGGLLTGEESSALADLLQRFDHDPAFSDLDLYAAMCRAFGATGARSLCERLLLRGTP